MKMYSKQFIKYAISKRHVSW